MDGGAEVWTRVLRRSLVFCGARGSLAALVKLAGRWLDEGHSEKTPPAAQLMRTQEEQLRWLRPPLLIGLIGGVIKFQIERRSWPLTPLVSMEASLVLSIRPFGRRR